MGVRGYEKLKAWQKADELVVDVYLVTQKFPKDELFGLTSQLRRAAVSIPTNLAEGSGRQGKNEIKYFANVALGSLAEVTYLIDLSKKLHFIADAEHKRLISLREELGALLWGFYKSF